MIQFVKKLIFLVLLIFVGTGAIAQKFSTHSVKRGETLEGIARQYKVSVNNILTYNKEIKQGQALPVNSILVVPINDRVVAESQQEPVGFISHKVRKKETLYGIAKRYNITVENIKKYNKQLYSDQLKKKMVLRIPKYRRIKPSETNLINEEDFETYTVAPKETRWSIAHKYGVTIDSMIVLNPILAKNSNYLAEGQELRMPKVKASIIGQETNLYQSYTVPKGVGIFRLTQELGVSSKEIMDLNPKIAENGGLKEGMIIRIPEKKLSSDTINTENYIFYEVKPKQTEFSLTRKLGISYKDLLALNPDLKDGLKAGMVLKLPKEQTGDFEVRNALVLDRINLLDSINVLNKPKVLFVLPFRLNKLNLSDSKEVLNAIKRKSLLRGSLGLYSGALVAIDSIASLGISVSVKTVDNQYDASKTKDIITREDLSNTSVIIGPLDAPSLREIAIRASGEQVPVVVPGPVITNLSMRNVFYSYSTDFVLKNRLLDYMKKNNTDQNIIIIADKASVSVKDSILLKFPNAKVVKVVEEEKNVGIDREKVAKLLSDEVVNWVFVETKNFKLATSVTSILNSFHNAPLDIEISEDKVAIRMFTTNRNSAFENDVISNSHLSNLNFTYPSVYREPVSNSFTRRYKRKFGSNPDRYAVRGFDLTYDLLLKLAYKNNLIEASKLIGKTEYLGNKFSYQKKDGSGYFNQACYIMSLEDMQITQVKE